MSIHNAPGTEADAETVALRNAIEHRATWFHFLLDEAGKAGADWEAIGREAVFRCGCFHGASRFTPTDDLERFASEFANEQARKIFEMDVTELSADVFRVEFHYCPLVSAWLKQTADEQRIATLCDIAMDGDRGIVSQFPAFGFTLGETISSGGTVCQVEITRKRMASRPQP